MIIIAVQPFFSVILVVRIMKVNFVSALRRVKMSVSREVVRLERENEQLRLGWINDLEALIVVAKRHNESKIVAAAEKCLASL